jgi:prepilin-type N-terminal cleavage/methylation domain-containing protein
MKIQRTSSSKRGFTLMELMVAMAITTIIVTVLVSITSIALDTWNRSRSELRASRQAKGMLDVMARDFEALVTRRGNTNEWLSAVTETTLPGASSLKSTNASKVIFFTAATDRYNGEIGKAADLGGDVSCVAYQLDFKDPVSTSSSSSGFESFVLSRLLVDPKPTFDSLLGVSSLAKPLADVFNGIYDAGKISNSNNFVCENIYQFTLTFHVQVSDPTKTPSLTNVPVTLGKDTKSLRILGTGIVTDPVSSNALLASGRITAVEISATVVSDFGVDQLKRRKFTGTQQAEFLAKNSYQYTKLVQLPSM